MSGTFHPPSLFFMKPCLTTFLLIVILGQFHAQYSDFGFKKDPLVKITKSGPYIGLQYGKYKNLELGYELQRKAVKLVKPTTHALNIGADFNLNQGILGFNLGYYQKEGRIDFTYGASLLYRTDFEHTRFGVSPFIGYKLYGFHLQAGVNLLTPNENFTNNNIIYASMRFVVIKNRSYDWRKREKKE